MTDTPEIKRIRAALKAYDEAGYYDLPQCDELQDACSTNSIRRILSHIDAQAAEIAALTQDRDEWARKCVSNFMDLGDARAEIAGLRSAAALAYFALCEESAAYEDPLEHIEKAASALRPFFPQGADCAGNPLRKTP